MNDTPAAEPDFDLSEILGGQIATWTTKLHELNRCIAIKTAERDRLQAKIAAAETLLERPPSLATREGVTSIREYIEDVLKDGVPRAPNEIREEILARGVDPSRVSTSTGNFYNTIRRLVVDGRVEKQPDGRYVRADNE